MFVHSPPPLADCLSRQPRLQGLQGLFPGPEPGLPHQELRQIISLLTEQYAAQEKRDLSSYMRFFWKSPLVACFTEDFVAIGWNQVKASVKREFAGRPAQTRPILERLRTNLLDGQTAITIEWWTLLFPSGKASGFTNSTWHKFPEGWLIIQTHTDSSGLR
ncbi:MAG TPA: hypothetical protein VGD78_14080 [Chthoniobacterales bacterium]